MKLHITQSEIEAISTNAKVFRKGQQLLDWIRPNGWTFLPDTHKLVGLIDDEQAELCCIDLNQAGRPVSYACTCSDSRNYWGFCPHAVALLLQAQPPSSSNSGDLPEGVVSDLLRLRNLYLQERAKREKKAEEQVGCPLERNKHESESRFEEAESLLHALERAWEALSFTPSPMSKEEENTADTEECATKNAPVIAPALVFTLQFEEENRASLLLPDAFTLRWIDRTQGLLQYHNRTYQLPDALLPCLPLYQFLERSPLARSLPLRRDQALRLLSCLQPLHEAGFLNLLPEGTRGISMQTTPALRLFLEKRSRHWMLTTHFDYGSLRVHPRLLSSDPPTMLEPLSQLKKTDVFSDHAEESLEPLRNLAWESRWIQHLRTLPLRSSPFTSPVSLKRNRNAKFDSHSSEHRRTNSRTPVYWLDENGLFLLTQSLLPLLPDPNWLELGAQTPRPQIRPLTCSLEMPTTQVDAQTTCIPGNPFSSSFSRAALAFQTMKLTFSVPIQASEWKAVREALFAGRDHLLLPGGVFLAWNPQDPEIQQLVQLLRVPGGSMLDKELTFEGLHALQVATTCPLPPQHPLRNLYDTLNQTTDTDALDLPEALLDKLLPYQQEGVRWLRTLAQAGIGGILADDMGLGKTLQLLSYLTWQQLSTPESQKRPALVIVPTALLYNWHTEACTHTPNLRVCLLQGSAAQRRQLLESQWAKTDLFLSTYAQIRKDIEWMQSHSFSTLVLDEAQAIKNNRTQTARAIKLLQGSQRFALTGTPIENHLNELWSLFDFLLPGYLPPARTFQKDFVLPIESGDLQVQSRLQLWIAPFLFRRVKTDVLQELPPKTERDLFCPLTPAQQKLYRKQFEALRQSAQEWHRLWRSQPQNARELSSKRFLFLTLLMRLRQICCHPGLFLPHYRGGSGKLEVLTELIDGALAEGHRILIFSQFTRMLRIVQRTCTEAGIQSLYLDGTLSAQERSQEVNRFQHGDADVFLLSLRAGGHGLNLTRADTVILLDPWWNPAVEAQAADRSHRMGQTQPVQIYRLLTAGTIEESILQLQKQKLSIIDTFVGQQAEGIHTLSPHDWMQLLQEEQDRLGTGISVPPPNESCAP